MYRFLVFSAFLAISNADMPSIDKNVFKNCSRIAFCTNLRHHVLEEAAKYSADIKSHTIVNNVVNIPLKNKNKESLILKVSLLEGNKARVKIAEPKSKRFELNDIIIVEELKELPLQGEDIANKSISFRPKDSTLPQRVVVTAGPPFTVEFYHGNDLRVVLNAERILMESTATSQVFTFGVEFQSDKLYGLFDHAYQLSLKETMDDSSDPMRLRNSDSWAYEANSPMALYGAVPAIYGHSKNSTSAIFLHNAAEQWIDITYNSTRPSAYFMVEGAAFDLFVLLGPTPKDLVRQMTTMTGKAHLPQLWTLGYHQCRFSYKSQDDVKNVVALLDKNDFPFDAIWLDGDHTDDYRWFRWNHTTYSDPLDLQKNVSVTGRKCVSISDPHIAVDKNYSVYMGAKDNYFVKWANGSNYEADCWPGLSSWIDYMIPEASDFYASWFSYDKFNGSTETLAGIWNDMNEPAVFDDSTEKTLPFEVLHNGSVKHGDIHNIYGFMHVRSTHKGLLDRDQYKKRPFILTRSTFAGSQRFAAMWTGDNSASWEHFANSYSQCMTSNLMGMVFCGADIGGFIGDPSDELLQRWYQGAVWTPFFRGHSSRESKRREPYLFSTEVQQVIRDAIRLRYRHIPSIYTLFFEHTRTGDPIIAPLFYHYPSVYERDTQMMIGTDIMAVAVTKPNVTTVDVLFPGGTNVHWYRIDSTQAWAPYSGEDHEPIPIKVDISNSPVFYRAGSIITTKDDKANSTTDAADLPYTLYVNLDADSHASGRLYLDDNISFDYDEKKKYFYINMTYISPRGVQLTVIDGYSEGFSPSIHEVVVHKIQYVDGKLVSKETRHKENADGVPLTAINIGKQLSLLRGDGLFIPLKSE
ncbi:hypothetical protein JTB14_026739 [Gonioctena quinquepunctata]|nr:hypothetical protein JTB14_026739 [Gonioctena quinquepunctata]